MDMKFFKCRHCGQIIAKVEDTKVPVICCGEKMEELVPNSVDAAKEKHVPVIKKEDGKVVVSVGSVPHPMLPEHFIKWIVLCTDKGNQRKELKPGEKPEATFYIGKDEKVVKAYAYCNLHGLWVGE